jgi:hypothetical protein
LGLKTESVFEKTARKGSLSRFMAMVCACRPPTAYRRFSMIPACMDLCNHQNQSLNKSDGNSAQYDLDVKRIAWVVRDEILVSRRCRKFSLIFFNLDLLDARPELKSTDNIPRNSASLTSERKNEAEL